jgi:hypothetical protein
MPENSRSKTVISVDGRTDIVSADKGRSLREIIKQLNDLLSNSNRVILSAKADGRPVFLSENRDLLNKKVEEFSLLEVETIDVRTQAVNALREVKNHLPGLTKALVEVTKSIQAGEVLKGYKSLATCADVLNLIVHVIDEVRALLGIDLTGVRMDGSTLSEQLEQVRNVLRDAKGALDTNDIVTVADLMEYELAPRIGKWDAILDTLLKTIGDQSQ